MESYLLSIYFVFLMVAKVLAAYFLFIGIDNTSALCAASGYGIYGLGWPVENVIPHRVIERR